MLYLFDTLSHKRGQVLDIDSSVRPLLEIKPPSMVLAQEISDFFQVYLQVRGSHQIVLIIATRYMREYVFKRVGNDSSLVRVVSVSCKLKKVVLVSIWPLHTTTSNISLIIASYSDLQFSHYQLKYF